MSILPQSLYGQIRAMRFVRPERGAARPGGVVTDEHLVREEVGVRSMVVSGGVWLVAGGWWLVVGVQKPSSCIHPRDRPVTVPGRSGAGHSGSALAVMAHQKGRQLLSVALVRRVDVSCYSVGQPGFCFGGEVL